MEEELVVRGVLGLDELRRPRLISWYGLRNMSVVARARSAPVPIAADVVPVMGSHRRFRMTIGFGEWLNC